MANKPKTKIEKNVTAEAGRDPAGLLGKEMNKYVNPADKLDKEMNKLKNPATVVDDEMSRKRKGKTK